MSFTLLRAPQPTSMGVSTKTTIVSPGNTEIADEVADTSISIKWSILIEDNTANTNMTYEIFARVKNSVATWTRTSNLGDIIPHELDVDISGGNIRLLITNDNINDITVRIARPLVL